MADFAGWLAKQDRFDDVDLLQLKEFAKQNSAEWPYPENDIASYVSLVASKAPDTTRAKLLIALFRAYKEWQDSSQSETQNSNNTSGWAWLKPENIGVGFLAVFGIIVAFTLPVGIFNGRLLALLAKKDEARGLITFLFAFSTIAVFLLMAITTFWMEKDEVKERFGSAKDLLTIVIGIMGTILGFYYGSAPSEATGSRTSSVGDVVTSAPVEATLSTLTLGNVAVSSPTVAPGEQTTISATISGGSAPYTYDITFNDPSGAIPANKLPPLRDRKADGDNISEVVTVPAETDKPTLVTFSVAAKDAKGVQARQSSSVKVQPK